MTEATIEPGTILADKYRVDRVLGVGGMGMVLAAHHLHLDERVAIKTLLPAMLNQNEAVERFVREARAAVKIKSEHVARVSDVGRLASGAPYMVMEFLEGEDLAERIAKYGPLPTEQAAEFILQACEALAEAHAIGIVHRDLKPANLFCVRRADGLLSIKVLDFGISKVTALGSGSGADMGMTKTTAVMGSPYYMAPEQMLSAKNADAQSDIWSLGAVLFELLTGRVPFVADTLPELVLKVSNSPAPDVNELREDVPLGLRTIVERCLQRDRQRRYLDVGELADALAEFGPAKRARASAERITRVLDSAGILSRRSRASLDRTLVQYPSAAVADAKSGTVAAFGQTTATTRPTSNGKLIAGVGVALLLVAGGAWFFRSAATAEPPSAPVPPTAAARPEPAVVAAPSVASPPAKPPAQVEPAQAEPAPAEPAAPPKATAPKKTAATSAKPTPSSASSATSSAASSATPAPSSTSSAPDAPKPKPSSAFGGRL
ncbi:MAG TPA: protein kinase [Polyangiaceae bacterium]|nr:protein kinase [Polyangiaceae bacterium]